ncbi:anti-anti-sigma factor [Amycolatopsis sp. WAC 04169]|uniref:STAS domain-containing protein n=1 Tax=Amycolatopsis sp. WAC 04169 TaxID=2203197 RepID=UPI000F78FC5A|nr:STAS domain-containing protein [Amycolatopsis sp. WAC 04169]RSN25566.1 anti-anti-sigma factor [Amycolatopsis sp. WAC 04169]
MNLLSSREAAVQDTSLPVGPGLRIADLTGTSGIRVVGVIDPSTRSIWEQRLDVLVGAGGGTIDLSRLAFADVRGVSALVDAARRVRPPRTLTVRHAPESVRKVLRLFWAEEYMNLLNEGMRP